MFLQVLSLISGLLLIVGLVLTANFTVAKNIATQKLSYALQVSSSRAINDAQSWAKDSIARAGVEGLVNDSLPIGNGGSQLGCVDTTCNWQFVNSWRVTGGTSDGGSGAPSVAENLEAGVHEGRISMVVTTIVYKKLVDPLIPLASRSQMITARTLNVAPFFVVTAVEGSNVEALSVNRSEGDSAGVLAKNNMNELAGALPSALDPSAFYRTVIRSQIQCKNSADGQNKNPFNDVPTKADLPIIPIHQYVPTNEKLAWIYEAPCNITFTPFDAPASYVESVNDEYDHVGSVTENWINGNASQTSIAK